MKKYYTYILKCSDGSLYCGYTVDLNSRLKEHNEGRASKYTRGRLPVKYVYIEEHEDKSSAMKRECAIKKLKLKGKIQLIDVNK